MFTTGITLIVFITLFRVWVWKLHIYQAGLDTLILALGTALLLVCFTQSNSAISKSAIANSAISQHPPRFHRPGSALTAFIRWYGRNSYEVYLTHMMVVFPIFTLARRLDPHDRLAPLTYLVVLIGSGLLGALIARYFSEPLNRTLRKR
jgi:peptidoglycan/LPS O-acetylase OafA/YrhL